MIQRVIQMGNQPKLSFIILSYNYANFVGKTLSSILEQTVQDFEVIVVDDASTDGSPEVIRAFQDSRIRLFVNEQNKGGTWSYNRAVSLAAGEYLVNLDSDDWIAPDKSELQLQAFAADPSLDIVGTYIRVVDGAGNLHSESDTIERYCNRDLDLNVAESWIVQNPLCRSSTMMRRSSHLRIGLDDPSMIYACDFELWTRALREGCRFHVLPRELTFYRWHGANITHRNPKAQFLEIVFLLSRNIVSTVNDRASFLGIGRIIAWTVEHDEFARLRPVERYRLLASLIAPVGDGGFAGFSSRILAREPDPVRERIGKFCLALFRYSPSRLEELSLYWDVCYLQRELSSVHAARDAELQELPQFLQEELINLDRLRVASATKEVDLWVRRFGRLFTRALGRSPSKLRQRELVRRSGLFDAAWYLRTNPDVARAGLDPLDHYLAHGAFEGRRPSPGFDVDHYFNTYLDLPRGSINPLLHYLRHGLYEGRSRLPGLKP